MRLSDLQNKDIVSIIDGRNIGNIIDVKINEMTGEISSLVVEAGKSFGKFFAKIYCRVNYDRGHSYLDSSDRRTYFTSIFPSLTNFVGTFLPLNKHLSSLKHLILAYSSSVQT